MKRARQVRAVALALVGAPAIWLTACSDRTDDAMTGYAEAELVYVSAPFAGVLESLAVGRGARVAAGDLLFRLDTDAEALARAEAQARLEQAQAQAANLRTGKRAPEVQAVESQLAQARAGLAASQSQLKRNTELVERGFVSPSVLDDLRAAERRDAARVQELQAQLEVARMAARGQEISAAEAAAQAAQASLAQSEWREAQKQQRAPAAALVYDVTYRVGERVPANAPVVVLLPDDAVKLRFFVPETRLAQVAVGDRVTVNCDGCPADLGATVSFVSPQAEFTPPVIYSNESRSKLVFMAEAKPDAAARAKLKPGQPVQVRPAAAAGRSP